MSNFFVLVLLVLLLVVSSGFISFLLFISLGWACYSGYSNGWSLGSSELWDESTKFIRVLLGGKE